jgi:hypothetical protein
MEAGFYKMFGILIDYEEIGKLSEKRLTVIPLCV